MLFKHASKPDMLFKHASKLATALKRNCRACRVYFRQDFCTGLLVHDGCDWATPCSDFLCNDGSLCTGQSSVA